MDPFDRSVDMLVARVRRKIEPDPKVPRFLLTVTGVGYKLITRTEPAKARQLEAEPIAPIKPEEIRAFFGWPKTDEDDTERAVTAFALMDSDCDGLISLHEFQAAYERIFKAMDADMRPLEEHRGLRAYDMRHRNSGSGSPCSRLSSSSNASALQSSVSKPVNQP